MSRTSTELPESVFHTPTELAAILGVPLSTLYQWRYKGEGPPACKVGRHLRYRREAVERWLLDRESVRSGD